jgi:hypothetical protein
LYEYVLVRNEVYVSFIHRFLYGVYPACGSFFPYYIANAKGLHVILNEY